MGRSPTSNFWGDRPPSPPMSPPMSIGLMCEKSGACFVCIGAFVTKIIRLQSEFLSHNSVSSQLMMFLIWKLNVELAPILVPRESCDRLYILMLFLLMKAYVLISFLHLRNL